MSETYYNERKDNITVRIRDLKKDLPYFCSEFFIGVENQTTPLTRINYAYDLRIFFDFLTKEIDKFAGRTVNQISLMDLNEVTASDIELFMDYLSYYQFKGKTYHNDERAKSRKLSTLRSFFKYYFKKEKIQNNITEKVDLPKLHDKGIVRLEDNEMADFLDQVETGYALSPTQQAFHHHTNARDYAIVSLLLGTGIRVSECVGLDVDDIDVLPGKPLLFLHIVEHGLHHLILVDHTVLPGYTECHEDGQRTADHGVDPADYIAEQAGFLTEHIAVNDDADEYRCQQDHE